MGFSGDNELGKKELLSILFYWPLSYIRVCHLKQCTVPRNIRISEGEGTSTDNFFFEGKYEEVWISFLKDKYKVYNHYFIFNHSMPFLFNYTNFQLLSIGEVQIPVLMKRNAASQNFSTCGLQALARNLYIRKNIFLAICFILFYCVKNDFNLS